MLQVSIHGKRKYQSLGISVHPDNWDFGKCKPKPSCPISEYIRKIISEKLLEMEKRILEYGAYGKDLTPLKIGCKIISVIFSEFLVGTAMPESFFLIPYRQGNSFFASEWSPDGDPKGVIVLIHGLSDHSGRYGHVGTFFASNGYTMIITDLRGHGRSFGKRGHFPHFDVIMDDVAIFLDAARRRHPTVPIVLYGHSMGGNIVLNYLIRRKPVVAGAVVTSPWLRLNFNPPLLMVILATLVNKVFPSVSRPDGVIPSYLSHDEEVAKKYNADPLVHGLITVRTYVEISRAGEYALKHADRVGCPLLLMHGTGDPLTSFSASKEFSENVIVNHTFKAWNELFHELHNEFEKEAVLGFIKEWTDSVILPVTPFPS